MKDSHAMPQPIMPLHTPPSFPHTQYHHNCIAPPQALDHTQDNKQCYMCHMGKLLGNIPSSKRQNHDPLLQHANTGQMEAQHCPMLCVWSLNSVNSAPADTHTYYLTQTNTASNMQTKTTEITHCLTLPLLLMLTKLPRILPTTAINPSITINTLPYT